MRVEKRFPFGFKGDWGIVYNQYVFDDKADGIIQWQGGNYLRVDNKVQFKELSNNAKKGHSMPVGNLVSTSIDKVIVTTDAHFENGQYECVVKMDAIINVFNQWWVVQDITEQAIFTPKKHSVYYISVKKIFEDIIKGV